MNTYATGVVTDMETSVKIAGFDKPVSGRGITEKDLATRAEIVVERLKKIDDPELKFSIIEIGLGEELRIENEVIRVGLLLTSPACSFSSFLMGEVEDALREVAPVVCPNAVNPRIKVEPILNVTWSLGRMGDELFIGAFVEQGVRSLPGGLNVTDEQVEDELARRL